MRQEKREYLMLVGVAGALAFLMGGAIYLTSGDDPIAKPYRGTSEVIPIVDPTPTHIPKRPLVMIIRDKALPPTPVKITATPTSNVPTLRVNN